MNSDLYELYQEIILDHNKNPRNHYAMEHATNYATGYNPICGDKITVYLNLNKKIIVEVSFLGSGCAISQASASLMTEEILGKNIYKATMLFKLFHSMLTNEQYNVKKYSYNFSILSGIRLFPSRVKCATLAWHTLKSAIKNNK